MCKIYLNLKILSFKKTLASILPMVCNNLFYFVLKHCIEELGVNLVIIPEADLEADFLSQSIVFWDHFEELQTVLIEVKLIINNVVWQTVIMLF